MTFGRVARALLTTTCVIGMTGGLGASAASAGAAERPLPPASPEQARAEAIAQQTANDADAEFVSMMMPHHFQALVMSGMAPERSNDQELLTLADRIDAEQDIEISMMQSWQGWRDLEVTDAEEAYQEILQDPEMLEQMGMATPGELDERSGSTGTAFDVQYLELMIEHHEGAIDMLVDVITNGNDATLEGWATDMLTTQQTQIRQMEAMLEAKS